MPKVNMKTVKKNPYTGGHGHGNSTSNLVTMLSGVVIGALLLFVTVDRVGHRKRASHKHEWEDNQAPSNNNYYDSGNPQKVSAEFNQVQPSDNLGVWIRRKTGLGVDFDNADSPASKALKWFVSDPYSKKVVAANNIPRITQRFVLATLFFATDGPSSWVFDGINWLLPTDECEWFGTVCNGYQLVTGLNMAGTKMRGQLPPTLGLLSHNLASLDLEDTELEGPLPTELGQLTQLTTLNLMFPEEKKFNKKKNAPPLPKFQGHTIPTELGFLSKLQYLDLDGAGFEGTIPVEIGFLTDLTTLRLSRGNNDIVGTVPETMERLTKLQELHLYGLEKLQGTLPSSICSPSLERAIIWCGKVECECCMNKAAKPCSAGGGDGGDA